MILQLRCLALAIGPPVHAASSRAAQDSAADSDVMHALQFVSLLLAV
jgi:hypothetical protein